MSDITFAVLIFIVTVLYFIITNKVMYLYTLKYYSLLKYIFDDRKALIFLNNKVLLYMIIIRYIRIHLVFSSLLVTLNIIVKILLIIKVLKITLVGIIIFAIFDITTIHNRCIILEDKLYKMHYGINNHN